MKEDKEIEKILLNDKNYEKFMHSKIEKEFIEITNDNKSETKNITDIKEVPKDKIFSKKTTYLVMNKNSKTKSYINGLQAEGFLGSDNEQRKKLISGEVDYFVCGNSYIKFYKYKA